MFETATGRGILETRFHEACCHLGPETIQGWCRRTILRAASCLFGPDTVVMLLDPGRLETKRTG